MIYVSHTSTCGTDNGTYLEAWLIAHGLKCCSASRTVSLTSESGRPDHLEWGRDFADWPPVVNDESNDFHELVPHVGPSK